MRDDDYPTPTSDPEGEGLPETADDDTVAGERALTGRQADGPSPAALPADTPVGVDKFGTTAEEQRQGAAMDYRLAQEEPDTPTGEPFGTAAEPELSAEADSEEAAAQAQLDADVMEPGPASDPRSAVSVYDLGNLDGTAGPPLGRLVEPDEGAHTDEEPDSVGLDAGVSGGGASAEELAVHETPPPELHEPPPPGLPEGYGHG